MNHIRKDSKAKGLYFILREVKIKVPATYINLHSLFVNQYKAGVGGHFNFLFSQRFFAQFSLFMHPGPGIGVIRDLFYP